MSDSSSGSDPSASSALVPNGGSIGQPAAAPAFDPVSVISPGQTVDVGSMGGGFLTIDHGGEGVFTSMGGGFVSNFGVAKGGTMGGGFISTLSGGLTSHWTTDGGFIEVFNGGSATAITDGSFLQVFTGGVASGDTIKAFEQVGEIVSGVSSGGGTAIKEVVKSGGFQDVNAGGVASSTTVSSGGFQVVSTGGTAGSTTVKSGGTEELVSGGVATSTTVSSGGRELISSGGSATLTTLKLGAAIDLAFLTFASSGKATLNSKTDVLTVTDGGRTYTQTLAGKYTGEKFVVSENTTSTNSGTVVVTVTCFAAGTAIATERGDIPVEALNVGDRVPTQRGGLRPIVWIGWRRVDCRAHPRPELVWPIRIRAGAFGENEPVRDLILSPGHSVFRDGVLIPAEHLINGATIVQEPAASVQYFHVELDQHDVVLAEGLAVESYLDDGNRGVFENGAAHTVLHPDFIPRSWNEAYAPRCTEGPALIAVRRKLHARALELGYRVVTLLDLRVLADGTELPPASVIAMHGKFYRQKGTLFRFAPPPGTREVCIVTPTTVPIRIDPNSNDRRTLGARILGVYLNGRAVPLHSRLLAGFHDIERMGRERWRWTGGAARIAIPESCRCAGPITLDLFVRDAMRRWSHPASAQSRAA